MKSMHKSDHICEVCKKIIDVNSNQVYDCSEFGVTLYYHLKCRSKILQKKAKVYRIDYKGKVYWEDDKKLMKKLIEFLNLDNKLKVTKLYIPQQNFYRLNKKDRFSVNMIPELKKNKEIEWIVEAPNKSTHFLTQQEMIDLAFKCDKLELIVKDKFTMTNGLKAWKIK